MSAADQFKGAPLPTQVVVVERGPIQNFATAVTDTNPVFRDPRVAEEQGFDAIPAPPTWPVVMGNWGAFAELQPEDAGGNSPVTAAIGALMSDGGLILHGEQEVAFERAVAVGDVLTGTGEIEDVYTKESGDRVMTFVVARTDWADQSGAPVCTTKMTIIHRK